MIATILTVSAWVLGLLGLSFWITLKFVKRMQPGPSSEPEEDTGPRVISGRHELFRRACRDCGAVYEYGWEHVQGTVSYVHCPVCGDKNWHRASNAVRR